MYILNKKEQDIKQEVLSSVDSKIQMTDLEFRMFFGETIYKKHSNAFKKRDSINKYQNQVNLLSIVRINVEAYIDKVLSAKGT